MPEPKQGIRINMLYDPKDDLAHTVPFPESMIDDLCDFLAERHFFGSVQRVTINDDARNIEPCCQCVAVTPQK